MRLGLSGNNGSSKYIIKGEMPLWLSENCSYVLSGRYLIRPDGGGAFYVPGHGTTNALGLKVNAWMTAPSVYTEDEEE